MVKRRKRLQAKVQKIIKFVHPDIPEKAQIAIDGGEDLYREIRVENELTDEQGEKVQLKPGAEVEIVVEADTSATIKKPA